MNKPWPSRLKPRSTQVSNLIRRGTEWICRRPVCALAIGLMMSVGSIAWHQESVSKNLIQNAALQTLDLHFTDLDTQRL